ncbi:MAG: hypothetical protein LBT91_00505, partial [Bifidobacteriaceae bacterium]|nr:hypothetical protein [Bifidobacteriaceae bacterium]
MSKFSNRFFVFPAISCLLAFFLVWQWFPENLWQYPIQFSDAPAHYYYIEKLISGGIGQIFHLTAEGGFYPPFFHIVAALFINIFHLSVMQGMVCSWLFFNATIFPIGMTLLVSFFIGRKNIFILSLIPLFSVSFFAFPYLLLHEGPLLAYGAAQAL